MPPSVSRNRLLASLSHDVTSAILARCETVTLKPGDVLHQFMQPIDFVVFPIDCVLSVVKQVDGGSIVEVMTVGNEGLSTLLPLFGVNAGPLRCLNQVSGEAVRVPIEMLTPMEMATGELGQVVGRYAEGAFNQVAQGAVCNVMHNIEQRCARWLLMTHDRAGRDEIRLTHQFLAFMLGVRRAGVTEVELKFREAGLIDYRRGNVSIRDRVGLERIACECYGAVNAEFDRLLGATARV
jgi:hypothetical protein